MRIRMITAAGVAVAAACALTVSAADVSTAGPPPPPKSTNGHKVQLVASGLKTPTSFAFGAGTAAGSFGQFLFAPFSVKLIADYGWLNTLAIFAALLMLLNRAPWHAPVTETARLGSNEIWSLVNLTEDTHPIHLHHVRFQVMDRRPFDRDTYLLEKGTLRFTGAALGPNPNETGWKDVVQCPPSTVTRIHISFAGFPGRYVWYCHVQEHEANDMMRPYDIVE